MKKKKSRISKRKIKKTIKKKEKKETSLDILRQSFQNLKSFDTVLIAFYDALFYLLLIAGAYTYLTVLTKIAQSLEYISFDSLFKSLEPTVTDVALIQAYTSSIKTFIWQFALLTIAFYIFIILAWSISRSLIWLNIAKKRLDLKFYIKFTGLTFLWDFSAGLLFAILYFGVKKFLPELYAYWAAFPLMPAVIFTIIIIIIFHFITINYYIFSKKPVFFKSIKKAFSIGTLNLKSFVLPYSTAVIIFIFVLIFSRIFGLLPASIARVFSYALLLLFFVWLRQCIALVVERLE